MTKGEDLLGSASTFAAIILNALQSGAINQLLTMILSGLSVLYMVIKLIKIMKKKKIDEDV